jgi:hypothetical protein
MINITLTLKIEVLPTEGFGVESVFFNAFNFPITYNVQHMCGANSDTILKFKTYLKLFKYKLYLKLFKNNLLQTLNIFVG